MLHKNINMHYASDIVCDCLLYVCLQIIKYATKEKEKNIHTDILVKAMRI